jgi:hypothetical protein
MSFQGDGTGISGTSNQFQTGYSQNAGYCYGNIGGYAPQTGYASTSATTQTLQVQGIGSATWGWQGQASNPAWLWGSNQGNTETVFSPGSLQVSYAGYVGSAGNINGFAPVSGFAYNLSIPSGPNGNSSWYWQGQGGTPNHLWGSNDGANMYVWQCGQMYMGTSNYCNGNIAAGCTSAGNANTGGTAYSALQQGNSCGTNAQLLGCMGSSRAGRNAPNGNYWGFFAAYNQQGSQSGQINFNNQFGGYWGSTTVPAVYQTPSGFNWQGTGYWNSNTQLQMYCQTNNLVGGWEIQIYG